MSQFFIVLTILNLVGFEKNLNNFPFNKVDFEVKTAANVTCSGPSPQVIAFAIQPSCDNDIPQSDGYLQLSAVTDGTHYHWSAGNTFDDNGGTNNFANATSLAGATYPLQFNTGLSNTDVGDFTIRVYNGANDCFTDVMVSLNVQDCTLGCDCEERIYLNETTTGGSVHKFSVNADGSLTEISAPWFDNTLAGEDLVAPHGVGMDLNGYIYIGETNDPNHEIRRFTCDGEIVPEGTFGITTGGQFNFGTIGNTLYVGEKGYNGIIAYDICSQLEVGRLEFCEGTADVDGNWGFYIDPNTETMYATKSQVGFRQNRVYIFDAEDFTIAGTPCVSSTDEIRNDANFPLRHARILGITTDTSENIYIVVNADTNTPFTTAQHYVLKYGPGPTYPFIARSDLDSLENGTGYFDAHGIIYSETANRIYVSTVSPLDDCVSILDTDLNYLGAAVPSPGDGSQAKGIAIIEECCPTNNNLTIDTILCAVALNDLIFLQEIINCSGAVCEGNWQVNMSTGFAYDACSNSLTVNALDACGTFTLESDGVGDGNQCGAFRIEVNICVNACDWGDLPDSSAATNTTDYQTLVANNGPVHTIDSSIFLGSTVDGEPDGQPSTDALGDGMDEDGLALFPSLDIGPGSTFRLPLTYVNTSGSPAQIEAWIDWNNNGEFGIGEMVFDATDPSAGFIQVTVPSGAVSGEFLGVRIRISNEDNMTPYGLISGGEVEDYLIGIDCPIQICVPLEGRIIRE